MAVANLDFIINGNDLANVTTIVFMVFDDENADSGITVRPGSLHASDTQVTAKIDISANAVPGKRRVSVKTSDGQTSNDRDILIDGCPPASPIAETSLFQVRKPSSNLSLRSGDQLSVQSLPAGSLVFTPVADGTVQQSDITLAQNGATHALLTTGPATRTQVVQIRGTSIDVVDRRFGVNFQRYGLMTGGALHLSGTTNLEDFARSLPVPASRNTPLSQMSFGAAGVIEFDLSDLKAALQQLNLRVSDVHATMRLTPIRSLNLFDFFTASPTQVPRTTQVILLDMAEEQKDLVIDYKDFPGFTSPRVSNLEAVSTTIANAPLERRATVRTDLLGLLAPLNFDVTAAVQRDLQTSAATTGFQIASQLNGTGLVFADSSNYIPGLSESSAPQLVIELAGFSPPARAQFVTSATRIPFDYLAQGFTDMMLVTVNNIGGSTGSIALALTSGANVFGLMTLDGRLVDAQSSTATIAAGERLTFAVTFKPPAGDTFQGELQVADITAKRKVIGKIALTGVTLPAAFSAALPTITAPVKPQRLPDQAARVGDLNGDGLIDAVDVAQLSEIVTGRVPAPQTGTVAFSVADLNGDGAINSADAGILGDALARNLDALPRLQPSASEITRGMRPLRRARPTTRMTGSAPASGHTGVAVMVRPR